MTAARCQGRSGRACCPCGPRAHASSTQSTFSRCSLSNGNCSPRSCGNLVLTTGRPRPGAPTGPRRTSFRHLCDGDAIGIAAGPGDRTLDVTAGFDPRITPRRWLAASAGESPDATLGRFAATTGELLGTGRYRLAQGVRFDVYLPYGPMDWTVRLLHRFWDSWLHERDVLLARGAEHPTDGDATAYATTYGVFIASAAASMFADPVQAKLTLGGDGGGTFEVDDRSGVTLTVGRGNTAGPPAAQVADALAGRSPVAAVLGDLPPSSRTALSHLADFFNTPVEQTASGSPT